MKALNISFPQPLKGAIVRFLEGLEAWEPGAKEATEVVLQPNGTVLLRVPMPSDEEASLDLGHRLAELVVEIQEETEQCLEMSFK